MILSIAYLGNMQYYTKLCSGHAVIDSYENYQKQSYRNRCDILTANGVASLIVPVYQPSGSKVLSREIRIDYSKKWQHQHWQAIVSSYRNAAYFAHYESYFAPFYTTRYDLLAELNRELQNLVLRLLRVNPEIHYATHYQGDVPDTEDLRLSLSPKSRLQRPDPTFAPAPYYQVFADRYPFMANLSVLDLLFCEGPAGDEILRASTKSEV